MLPERKSTLNLQILSGLPDGSTLVRDFIQGESHLSHFFTGSFRSPSSYQDKLREVDHRFSRDARESALSFLAPPSDSAAGKLVDFVDRGGVFVTTGQQPGLLAGPLYSLYKAISAVKLAEALEPLLKRPVLPLFWIASEDHDWEEVDHTHLLDVDNEIRTFRLPAPEGRARFPLHRIPVDGQIDGVLADFIQTLPQSEFAEDYLLSIQGSYGVGATLPSGFRKLLQALLSHTPLLFVDGAEAGLKEASLPTLFRELAEAEPHEALLARTSSHLEMDGYHAQVPVLEGGVNLFFEGPAGRDRLYREGAGFRLNRAGVSVPGEEIRSRSEADPTLLSPNVFLRPVVESTLFPTVAYVAGPGEIAYYAQLKGLFQAHGIQMPVIVPRHSATLLEAKVGKVLDKFHLAPGVLARPFHELAADIARDDVPPPVRQALGELRGALGEGTGALARAIQEIDPTLKGPVTHARNAAFGALDEAEKKILQAVKRQNETALEQIEKAQHHIFPLGKHQERVLNPFYYLFRYGPEFLEALFDAFLVDLDEDSA